MYIRLVERVNSFIFGEKHGNHVLSEIARGGGVNYFGRNAVQSVYRLHGESYFFSLSVYVAHLAEHLESLVQAVTRNLYFKGIKVVFESRRRAQHGYVPLVSVGNVHDCHVFGVVDVGRARQKQNFGIGVVAQRFLRQKHGSVHVSLAQRTLHSVYVCVYFRQLSRARAPNHVRRFFSRKNNGYRSVVF